jgi:beta-lysine 5,6-aminomutase alpha subunit
MRVADDLVKRAEVRVRGNREFRAARLAEWKDRNNKPLLYLIVATGNIYEDVKQATAAAQQGADVIAVIRTTAQSLLDYVPYGPTRRGSGAPTPRRKISASCARPWTRSPKRNGVTAI